MFNALSTEKGDVYWKTRYFSIQSENINVNAKKEELICSGVFFQILKYLIFLHMGESHIWKSKTYGNW